MTRRIAFFAPMKSPNHAVPSGDREMARALMAALSGRGDEVELVSELRIYDGVGDQAKQQELSKAAQDEVRRLLSIGHWDGWFTYHNYYKAPDLIGPVVAKALGIPYAIAEPSRADKRLTGSWSEFEKAAGAACDAAQVMFHMTSRDREVLQRHVQSDQIICPLAPFLPITDLPETRAAPERPVILAAGMMREGDKLASFARLAHALTYLETPDWQLHIAGDGKARTRVETLFAPFGDKVRFLGQLDRSAMTQAYLRSAVLAWPGVNEAFGMVYLEAQSHGCPAIAEAYSGPATVLPQPALTPIDDTRAMAAAIDALLSDADHWAASSKAARKTVMDRHMLGAACDTLWEQLDPLMEAIG